MDIIGTVSSCISIAQAIFDLVAAAKELHTETSDAMKDLKVMVTVLAELSGLFSRRAQGKANTNALEPAVLGQINSAQCYLESLLDQVKDIGSNSAPTSRISVLGRPFRKARKVIVWQSVQGDIQGQTARVQSILLLVTTVLGSDTKCVVPCYIQPI